MGKPKYIEDHDTQNYKKVLAEFMATINPKDKPEVMEILRRKYLSARERNEPSQSSL